MATSKKRSRLREFQAVLAERLRIAVATPQDKQRKLGLRIGERNWLLDLTEAGEIITVPEITPVPLTVPWYRGLVNVRGNLLSVIDLQQFMGGAPTPMEKGSCLLGFNARLQFPGAILVSRMQGLRSLSHMTQARENAAQNEATTPHWVGQRYWDEQAEIWVELRLQPLITDEFFLRVSQHLAA